MLTQLKDLHAQMQDFQCEQHIQGACSLPFATAIAK